MSDPNATQPLYDGTDPDIIRREAERARLRQHPEPSEGGVGYVVVYHRLTEGGVMPSLESDIMPKEAAVAWAQDHRRSYPTLKFSVARVVPLTEEAP